MSATPLPPPGVWRGFHCLPPATRQWPTMPQLIKRLAALRINLFILQVDYRFAFRARPDLRGEDPLSPADLAALAGVCADHGITLVPQFNCLGHQDINGEAGPLLRVHPEFEEPACSSDILPAPLAAVREWCPSHPGVHEVVLPLIDEIIDACDAQAIHVGLDEVMRLGSFNCPRCAGKNRGELFAQEVDRLHAHLTKTRGLQMMMWGDRLIDGAVDGAVMDHGPLESSHNGTATAIDSIPRDIIVCDWHYERRASYPSVAHFVSKGFRVLPAVWRDAEQADAFLSAARTANTNSQMLGTLFTTWSQGGVLSLLPGVDDAHHDRGLMQDIASLIEATDRTTS